MRAINNRHFGITKPSPRRVLVLSSGETEFTVAKLPQKLNPACVQGDVVIGDVVQYMRQLRNGGNSYAVKKLNLASANATHYPVLLTLKRAARTAAPATTSA
jgi:hypothetical protein